MLLVGGRTGRDGCGGATGLSEHTENRFIPAGGSPKGNAPTERKIQRLFRNPRIVPIRNVMTSVPAEFQLPSVS